MKWSSGWGAACDPCAKAKTRCIRPERRESNGEDPKCNRCQSLNIDCPQQVRKPRKKRRRQSDVTSPQPGQAKRRGRSSLSPAAAQTAPAPSDGGPRKDAAEAEPNVYVAQIKLEPTRAFIASTSLPGFHPFPTATCTCIPETDGKDDHPTWPTESDETLLAIYRERLSPQFPFVIVSHEITAVELQRSRPFLFKAIKMVASIKNRRSMWSQNKLLLRQISDAVFQGPDRSLDLLQSVVVFLGFYHYFCWAHGQFDTLSNLAAGIISDMRLDRQQARPVFKNRGIQGMDPEAPKELSNDQRRALLAVWYLNSSFAVMFKKVNSPGRHFTRHMERQLQELHGRLEFETDQLLAQLVYAQRINEMIAQFQQSEQTVDIRLSSTAWTAQLDRLLGDLGNLRGYKGQQVSHSYLVSSHHSLALLQLLEPQLLEADHEQYHGAVAALQQTPAYFHSPSTSRKDAADTALRAWFEEWLNIPVCHFFYMPMSGYTHVTDAVVVLLRRARVALLNRHRQGGLYAPELNIAGGSQDLMLDVLERLASRFEEARIEMAAAHCSEWANDLLDLIAWKLRERKACIEKWVKLIAHEALANPGSRVEVGDGQRPSELAAGYGSDLTPFQSLNDPGLWLDPLETLLMSGGEPSSVESWL